MVEFNLSEKILEKDYRYYLDIAWVKEFIRLLKEELCKDCPDACHGCLDDMQNEIDKLAGEKLNGT